MLAVRNDGPATAHDVTVDDDLPAGLTLVSATPDQGSCNSADPLSCNVGTIQSGATVEIDVVATIAAGQAGNRIENSACASATEPDPDGANNCDDEPIDVDPDPPPPSGYDLSLVKSAKPGKVKVGDELTSLRSRTRARRPRRRRRSPTCCRSSSPTFPTPATATPRSCPT